MGPESAETACGRIDGAHWRSSSERERGGPEGPPRANDVLSVSNYQLLTEQVLPDCAATARVTAPPPVGREMLKSQPDFEWAVTV